MKLIATFLITALATSGITGAAGPVPADPHQQLTDPDGKSADQTKKVKVFILMGQSNMVGMGDILPADKPGTLTTLTKTEKKYPFLVDDAGQWTARKDVFYYDARVKKGGALTVTSNGNAIGPELGFGFVMGQLLDEPVLVLKSCTGNRSLGWDLLPPGSERYTAEVTERGGQIVTKVFAGYKDKPDWWIADAAKGTATEPPPWLDPASAGPWRSCSKPANSQRNAVSRHCH